jgi:hypothetical protein
MQAGSDAPGLILVIWDPPLKVGEGGEALSRLSEVGYTRNVRVGDGLIYWLYPSLLL